MFDSSSSFTCVDCGRVFDLPKKYRESHGLGSPPYETYKGCPDCGGRYVNTVICDCCGTPITGHFVKTKNYLYYCDNCFTTGDIMDENID